MAEQDNAIYRGDDTAAFGNNFLTIKVKNPLLYKVSKVIFSVNGGIIEKTFTDPDFFQREETLLYVNFTSEETRKLSPTNTGNLVPYDEENRQTTCRQSVTFYAQNGVICNVRRNCC